MQMAPPLLLKVDSILRSRLECVSTQARDLQCTCNFLIFGRYRVNMTVYIYYNPFTRPSGPSGQWPMNGRISLVRQHMENDEWLWLTSNGMATCWDEPLTMSSSLINMFPSNQNIHPSNQESRDYFDSTCIQSIIIRDFESTVRVLQIIRSWSDQRFQIIMTSMIRTVSLKYRTGPFDAWVKPVWRINLTKIKQKTWVRLAPLNLSFFRELQFCPI